MRMYEKRQDEVIEMSDGQAELCSLKVAFKVATNDVLLLFVYDITTNLAMRIKKGNLSLD